MQGEEQDRKAIDYDQRVCEALPVVGLEVDPILTTPSEISIRGYAVGGPVFRARPTNLPPDRDLGTLELGVISCTDPRVAEFVLILLYCLS